MKKSKSMTKESQVENHKLAHKVLDIKNLLVFVPVRKCLA